MDKTNVSASKIGEVQNKAAMRLYFAFRLTGSSREWVDRFLWL